MVIPVSRLSASCASGDLEGKTNDLASVMKERPERRSVVVAVLGPRAPGPGEQQPGQEVLQQAAEQQPEEVESEGALLLRTTEKMHVGRRDANKLPARLCNKRKNPRAACGAPLQGSGLSSWLRCGAEPKRPPLD